MAYIWFIERLMAEIRSEGNGFSKSKVFTAYVS